MISCNLCHNFSKQSKNDIKSIFQFWSTPALENIQFTLRISSENRTAEWQQVPADCGGMDLNTVVNQPTSGKLCKCTTVWSQCDILTYPWMCCTLFFNWWPHFEKYPVIVNPIKCLQIIHKGLLVIIQWQLRGWVIVARNYIFSLIWRCYGPKRDILDYWGTILYCLWSFYILSKDKGL